MGTILILGRQEDACCRLVMRSCVRLDAVDGVLCRSYGLFRPEDFDTPDGQYVSAEWHALLMAWMTSMRCPVVNRIRPELSVEGFRSPANKLVAEA